MIRFLHGGWLLFGILFGNRILSKPVPPPPTNLQLSPGRNPISGQPKQFVYMYLHRLECIRAAISGQPKRNERITTEF
jgi:hypothetical protein